MTGPVTKPRHDPTTTSYLLICEDVLSAKITCECTALRQLHDNGDNYSA